MRIDHKPRPIGSKIGKAKALNLRATKLEEIKLLEAKIKNDITIYGMSNRLEPIRTCRKCKFKAYTEDDLEFFSKDSGMLYGRATICKECDREKTKKYMKANYEKTGGNGGLDRNKNVTLYYVKITTPSQKVFYKLGLTQKTLKTLFGSEEAKTSIIFKSTLTNTVGLLTEKLILRQYDSYLIPETTSLLKGTDNKGVFVEDIFSLEKDTNEDSGK